MSVDSYKTMLLNAFYDIDAFRQDWINGFTLSSGQASPFYVDCRVMMSYPYIRDMVATMACWVLRDKTYGAVGGLELGSISFAQAISDKTQVRSFIVRKEQKSHGTGRRIEGAPITGPVIIVDDVYTTGKSIVTAAKVARDHGMQVTDALVIVDRSNRDWVEREQFKQDHGITVHSLVTLRELEEWKALK